MKKNFLYILLTVLFSLQLISCGKKGDNSPPEGVRETHPRTYPSS